jgi:hypothetical protein
MSFWPELSLSVQHAFQFLYGALLLLFIGLQLFPHCRRFLLSERWGGYTRSGRFADWIQHPFVTPIILLIWIGCGVVLMIDWQAAPVALLNVLLSRYYFVAQRWNGVQRGFGAPGFMTYCFGVAVLLLAFARNHAPSLHSLVVLYIQVDIALIIFSAGFYKLRSGYRQGEGMDYGMVNPMWGYWPRLFRRLPTSHFLFRFLNQSAWTSQFFIAATMLIPSTRWIGGLVEIATYAFIATQIRLGWLAEQMMLTGLLFFTVGSPAGNWWERHWPMPSEFGAPAGSAPELLVLIVQTLLWVHLVLTPLCHAGLFWNYYGRRRLPEPIQRALERYTNFFGIIVWRVFSVDHVNFFVQIHVAPPESQPRRLVSEWTNLFNFRFWHVNEAIAVTSLFTTLKYYPGDDAIFRERLFRYARTLPCPLGDSLVFTYHTIRKESDRYVERSVCEFHIDPAVGTLRIVEHDPSFSVKAAHATSPIHAATRPGSYAPPA